MVNPLLTISFQLLLIGSASAVIAAMVREYRVARLATVGGAARRPAAVPSSPAGRPAAQRRSRPRTQFVVANPRIVTRGQTARVTRLSGRRGAVELVRSA